MYIQQVEYEFAEFNRYNSERIDDLLASDAAIKIAVVGDSRIRYGIDPAELQSELEDRLGVTVAALTLTANRGTWARLEASLSGLMRKDASLVVLIDENLFTRELTWLYDFQLRRDFAIWTLTGRGPWGPDGSRESQIEQQGDLRCEGHFLAGVTPEQHDKYVSKFHFINPAGGKRAAEFAGELAENGVRVATVFIPARTGAEFLVWQRPVDGMTLGVDFVPEPTLYCDPIHLNDEGRDIFTRNLADSLSNWLRS